ncbi:MAG: DUF72 domain-containing protein [Leptolyngbya sp.]|nr:DUF72 domain-containing protein [Leptolyngbya sp.]
MENRYFTGCAVWAYKDWVGSFYPQGSRAGDFLRLYGDRMTAVEGNTTFYSQPDAKTIQRWAETMPAGFRFCPKLPKVFSHQGKILPHLAQAQAFMDTLAPLGDRLGPVFLQLPPTYRPAQGADLRDFLTQWPRQRYPIAVEVRHLDWFAPPIAHRLTQVLTDLGVGRVLLDTRPIYDGLAHTDEDPQLGSERRKPQVPLQPEVTAPFTIIRYISHPSFSLNDPYLAEWTSRLAQWLAAGTTVYFFAHCPQEIHSPRVAQAMYHRLQQAGVALPALPWESCPSPSASAQDTSAQLSLF